jgi:hypothetical protein
VNIAIINGAPVINAAGKGVKHRVMVGCEPDSPNYSDLLDAVNRNQ